MSRRRGQGHSSTVRTVLSLAFLLGVLVVLAILLTPEREEAPPVSTIAYQDRPTERDSGALELRRRGHRGDAPEVETPDEVQTAEPAQTLSEPTQPDAIYAIVGRVIDGQTGDPVTDVFLLASRVPSAEEESAFQEKDRAIVNAQQSEDFSALLDEKQRIWADEKVNAGRDGHFRIPIVHAGDYKITVVPQNYLRKTVEKRFVGDGSPEWQVEISLDVGASIAGRITDNLDNQGVSGLTVRTTEETTHHTNQSRTDENGYYHIQGLAPGNYSVIADIEATAYRVTKVLPFQRTAISNPDQQVRNIDFKLDKGGVVWGYVTTPDSTPVASRVVLCTSESVLTQALTAMVRQAPPLSDSSSKDDGYYELVGVPLNEEWRLYAAADNMAPQLANPFIVTPRNKEVRVDITVFTGSNVYGQVVDSKGKAVAEAQVMGFPSYGRLMSAMDTPPAVRETRSDAEGYFELPELPAGNYQVMAHKKGFKYAVNGEPLYVNGYHEVKNFRIVLEGIESGKYRVYGYVVDSTGRALADAAVTLSGLGMESLNGIEREETTDSGGEFEFDGVEIGTYVLHAQKDGYSRKTLGRVLLDEPNELVMEAAAVVRGRVLVQATNAAPENGYTVSSQKLGSEDAESRNNLFSLLESGGPETRSEEFRDPQGHYELTLAAGTWLLEASARPQTPARKSITLTPGQVLENIDLILSNEGGTIEGRLIISDGQSPQGASVSLIEATTAAQALTQFAQDGGGLQSMQVGDDGTFTFERLPEGMYFAVARHPAYPQAMSPSIALADQGTASGVEIYMGPGGSMEGYVYDAGRPAPGWVVTVIANGQPYTGTTDRTGAYDIRNIPEGNFQAFASNPNAGLNLDALNTQGEPVTIWSGSVTYKNFGEFNDVKVHVTIVRGAAAPQLFPNLENAGGRLVLNPGSAAPIIGSGIRDADLSGALYTVISQSVTLDVPVGEWRVDYYDPERVGSYVWRGAQDFVIVGDEEEIDVVLYTN